jgi:hypothetical protein
MGTETEAQPSGRRTGPPGRVVHRYRFKPGRGGSNRFAIVTSILSLLVAAFGSAFTVLRAQVDDQSKLRTELTESDRRLAQVTYGPQGTGVIDERTAIAAQMNQIISRVRDVSPIYYRHLASAENSNGRHPQALAHADIALRGARAQHDLLEETNVHRLKAGVYRRIGDPVRMRSEFAANRRLTLGHLGGALGSGLRNEAITSLKQWASGEADFRNCREGRALLAQARVVAEGSPPVVRKYWTDDVAAAQKAFKCVDG